MGYYSPLSFAYSIVWSAILAYEIGVALAKYLLTLKTVQVFCDQHVASSSLFSPLRLYYRGGLSPLVALVLTMETSTVVPAFALHRPTRDG
jgi:hypothetical protein